MQTKASFHDTVTEREKKNQRLTFEAACEGIVLLENDGTLPLKPGKLAIFGAGAGYTIQGGSGSGEVNVRHAVNALEGLESAGFTVTTKGWIDRYDASWKQGKEAFLSGKTARSCASSPPTFWPSSWLRNTAIPAGT